MDMEMRDAMTNMPGTAMLPGRSSSRKFAVLAAPPAAFAMPPNMPANRKMKIMMVMLSSPMPFAQRWIFSSKVRLRSCAMAVIHAMVNARTTDMM